MSDPNKFPPHFTIQFKDTPIKCHRQNTWLYTFQEVSDFNHVFIDRSTRTKAKGIYLWERQILKEHDLDMWHKVIQGLGSVGVETIEEPAPSEHDKKVYRHVFGDLGSLSIRESGLIESNISPQNSSLSPRQEHKVEFLHHLLEHDLLTPQDFQGRGNLEI